MEKNKKIFWAKICTLIAIVVCCLIVDLVTKYVFDATLADGKTVAVIPYLFNFKLVHNLGAAWGIMAGKQVFLIFISIIFLAMFVLYYVKEPKKSWLLTVCFAFLLAGCLGNLFDRIFFGYVRDFIQFAFWQEFPIFNFADTFLTVGIVLFVIYVVFFYVKNRKKSKEGNKDEKNS